jgi:hypothetical protein
MFALLVKLGVDTAWYMTSGVWYLGKRVFYGREVDPAEKALHELQLVRHEIERKMDQEMVEIKALREELKSVKEHNQWLMSLPVPVPSTTNQDIRMPLTQQYMFLRSGSTTNDASIDTEHSIESDNNQHNKDLNTHTHLKACPLDVEQPVVVEEGSTVPSVTGC